MTQESNHRSSASKRSSRTVRNRPMLVTPTTPTESTTGDALVAPTAIEEAPADLYQPAVETSPTETETKPVAPTGSRKLAGFFSRVGKSTQEEPSETDAAQARLARATRGKAATSTVKTAVPAKKSEVREPVKAGPPASARSAPARPRSGFKTRYILGLAIYLLGAQLIGAYEATFLNANHMDGIIFKIGSFAITTSTLVFLATLVILLVILARFDLIPRNLGTLMGQPTSSRRTGSASSRTEETVKTPPPAMKQGVKGDDDDLYQEYQEQRRYQQRRERKR